jgi:hypothetical protein
MSYSDFKEQKPSTEHTTSQLRFLLKGRTTYHKLFYGQPLFYTYFLRTILAQFQSPTSGSIHRNKARHSSAQKKTRNPKRKLFFNHQKRAYVEFT